MSNVEFFYLPPILIISFSIHLGSLKSILMAAGALKRKMHDYEEEIVALKALVNVNLPKFT